MHGVQWFRSLWGEIPFSRSHWRSTSPHGSFFGTVGQRCFALAAVLAHLGHLALEGRANLVEDAFVAYLAM